MSVIMAETAKYGFRDGFRHCEVSDEERAEFAKIAADMKKGVDKIFAQKD